MALSKRVKQRAETGSDHRLARRLAALFDGIIPNAPVLISRYGERVSEILKFPGVNPQGTTHDGPFSDYVGADATTIWAGATSGVASIAISMLAALLASRWTATEATAIWVELIEFRKAEILAAVNRNEIVPQMAVFGAQQEFSRKDLAAWDTSARAWICCAEKAKHWESHQLELISKNVTLGYARGANTYEKVILSWYTSMIILNNLLEGKPQMISNKAVLHAFKAWNFYPDLIVLDKSTTNVKFRDRSFPEHAVATIRAELSHTQEETWSLMLSHLRYYGQGDVAVEKPINGRLTIEETKLAFFGSLLGSWQIYHPTEILTAAQVFHTIFVLLGSTGGGLQWIELILEAAKSLAKLKGESLRDALQLVQWAARHGRIFADLRSNKMIPFFGLCHSEVLASLRKQLDSEAAISFLRAKARKCDCNPRDCIIVYTHRYRKERSALRDLAYELATVIEGSGIGVRWLCPAWHDRRVGSLVQVPCSPEHQETVRTFLISRMQEIATYGEICSLSQDEGFQYPNGHLNFCTQSYRPLYGDFEAGLFVKADAMEKIRPEDGAIFVKPDVSLDHLHNEPPCSRQLRRYLVDLDKAPISHRGTANLPTPGISVIADFYRHSSNLRNSFEAARSMFATYDFLQGATISQAMITKPFAISPWAKVQDSSGPGWINYSPSSPFHILAGILYCEADCLQVDPRILTNVFAVCSGNSLFVNERLLNDPGCFEPIKGFRHLVGSIGHPGISLLVSPILPAVREPTKDFRVIPHAPYDRKREDNFRGTTLHLNLTGWSIPVVTTTANTIDQNLCKIEAVVRVFDGAAWVADIDVLRAREEVGTGDSCCCNCLAEARSEDQANTDVISIDTWEELLDPPLLPSVFRAHGNWAARLAARCILEQKGLLSRVIVAEKPIQENQKSSLCFRCLQEAHKEHPSQRCSDSTKTIVSPNERVLRFSDGTDRQYSNSGFVDINFLLENEESKSMPTSMFSQCSDEGLFASKPDQATWSENGSDSLSSAGPDPSYMTWKKVVYID